MPRVKAGPIRENSIIVKTVARKEKKEIDVDGKPVMKNDPEHDKIIDEIEKLFPDSAYLVFVVPDRKMMIDIYSNLNDQEVIDSVTKHFGRELNKSEG